MDSSYESADPLEQQAVHDSPGESLIISSQKVKKYYEKQCADIRKKYHLTQNEIDVVMFLHAHPQMDTAKEIAGYRYLSRSLVCKSVEDLIAGKYLIAVPDKRDRRYLHLKLTQRTQRLIEELLQLKRMFWSALQENITEEEMEVFWHTLRKIHHNLNKVFPDSN